MCKKFFNINMKIIKKRSTYRKGNDNFEKKQYL